MAMDALGIDRENVNTSTWRREMWQMVRDNRHLRPSAVQSLTRRTEATAAEQRLLGLLFADANLRHEALSMLREEDYEDLATAPLFKALFELEREGAEIDFDNLNNKIAGDEFATRMIPMVLMNSSLHGSNEHYVAEECVSTFRLMKVEQRIEELRRELLVAEREQDSERLSSRHRDLRQPEVVARGVAEAASIPYGRSWGSSTNSTPRADELLEGRAAVVGLEEHRAGEALPHQAPHLLLRLLVHHGRARDRHQHDREPILPRRADREPAEAAELGQRDVGADLETDLLGVEGERLVLVVDPELRGRDADHLSLLRVVGGRD